MSFLPFLRAKLHLRSAPTLPGCVHLIAFTWRISLSASFFYSFSIADIRETQPLTSGSSIHVRVACCSIEGPKLYIIQLALLAGSPGKGTGSRLL